MPRHLVRVGERIDRAKAASIIRSLKESPTVGRLKKIGSHPEIANRLYYKYLNGRVAKLVAFKAVEPMKFLGKNKMLELRRLLERDIALREDIRMKLNAARGRMSEWEWARYAEKELTKNEVVRVRDDLSIFVMENNLAPYMVRVMTERVEGLLDKFHEAEG